MSGTLALQSVAPIVVANGSINVNLQWTIPTPVDVRTVLVIPIGNTNIVPAVGSTYLIITPQAGTGTALIKGNNADVGIPMNNTIGFPTILTTGATTIVMTVATATLTCEFLWL